MVDLRHLDPEHVRGEPRRLLDDPIGGEVEGDAADGQTTAPVGVHPERDNGGIAVQDFDIVHFEAEPVGHDLRPRRLVSLAVR